MKKHILILFIIINITVFSQETVSKAPLQKYVELKYHYGGFAKNTDKLNPIMDYPYNAIDIKVAIQTNGRKKELDQIYGYPTYGIGLYKIKCNSTELGSPNAVYIFMKVPIIRGKKLTWNFGMAPGLAFGFNKYNPETNPKQKIIGSSLNMFYNFNTGVNYEISSRIDLGMDLDLTHFSNGAIKTPNIGVNMYGIAPYIRCNFNNGRDKNKSFERTKFNKKELNSFTKHSNIQVFGGIGAKKTTDIYDGASYLVSSISLDYAYSYDRLGMIGFGIDEFYESSLRHYPLPGIENPTFADLSYTGIHVSHFFKIYFITLITQVGYNLTPAVNHKGMVYIVASLNYHLSKNFFVRSVLKTRNGAVADFLELGLGYNFALKK